MPNSRLTNITPNVHRMNVIPNFRVSSFQTGVSGHPKIVIGSPIGLLLALTYAEAAVPKTFGDFRPNARIVNI